MGLLNTDPIGPHIDNLARHVDDLARRLELVIAKSPEPFLGMHAPDWIQAALLVTAVVALVYTGLTLRETARGRDVENYLKFLDLIANAWRRYGAAPSTTKRFEFLELMNLLEAACHMFNEMIIRGTTREMIKDYLSDILPKLFGDPNAANMIQSAMTGQTTFIQIRYFAYKAKLNGVTQAAPPARRRKFW